MSETDEEYIVKMDNGDMHFIYGKSAKDIFSKIDGLRLLGKLWLETFDRTVDLDGLSEETSSVFVNINHIVSIQ